MMQMKQTVGVSVVVGLAILMVSWLMPAPVTANTATSGGTSETNRYINIEEAMREYNARYMYFTGDDDSDGVLDNEEQASAPHVVWPYCEGCGGRGPAPKKPEDGTYKARMHNATEAIKVVEAVINAFYSELIDTKPLYDKFYKIEGETGTTFSKYVEADFPLTWVSGDPTWTGNSSNAGLTEDNYKQAAEVITQYIKQLTATNGTDQGGSLVGVAGATGIQYRRGDGTSTQGIDPNATDVFDKALTDTVNGWNNNPWTTTIPASDTNGNYSRLRSHSILLLDVASFEANYSATRGRIEITGSAGSEYTIYLKIAELINHQEAFPPQYTGVVEPLSNLPTEGDLATSFTYSGSAQKWRKYTTYSGAGTHHTPPLGDGDPEWAGTTSIDWLPNSIAYWEYAWELFDFHVAKHPQFDASPDGGCDTGCGTGQCPDGEGVGYSNESVSLTFGMGMLDSEMTAGRLTIHVEEPTADLYGPSLLEVVTDPSINTAGTHIIRSGGVLRQVWTTNRLVDILTNAEDSGIAVDSYELRFYREDQVETTQTAGLWVPETGEVPYKTVVISKPSGVTAGHNVRITEKDDGGLVMRVSEYFWDDTDDFWTLAEGLDKTTPTLASALGRESFEEDVVGDTRTEVRKFLSGDGATTLAHVEEVYTQYPFGWVMTQRTVDPTTAKLTEAWTYYAQPGEAGYGNLKSYTSETGY
ncbi:MAG: hypothetical protein AAGH88_15395 [Planctomycetota bacterium]